MIELLRLLHQMLSRRLALADPGYVGFNGYVPRSLWERFEKAIQTPVAAFELTSEIAEDLNDFSANIAQHLTHDWEDCGIGGYEFWGCKGVHTDWRAAINEESVWVKVGSELLNLPMRVEGMYEHAGRCPGEDAPRHHCDRNCDPVQLPFVATLVGVISVGSDLFAEYSVENKKS